MSEPWLERIDGTYVVSAETLAARFGLTIDGVRAAMRTGHLVSVSESGVGEDAGRVRLTFRYGLSIWRVLIEPDGGVSEDFEVARLGRPEVGA